MIIWGGGSVGSVNTGGRYNPSTDTWLPTSTGANVPEGRNRFSVVWTSTEMIIWGETPTQPSSRATGARYDPSTDTWTPTSTGPGVPSRRIFHRAVWTGSEMIVWGGFDGAELNTGGRYNPASDTWIATSTGAGTPPATSVHTAVWAESHMIVWGGFSHDSGVYVYCACPDEDDDGVCNGNDPFPASDPNPTVVIDACDSGVANEFLVPGANMGDLIGRCAGDASSHGAFVSCVAQLTIEWIETGQITTKERNAIQRCAALP